MLEGNLRRIHGQNGSRARGLRSTRKTKNPFTSNPVIKQARQVGVALPRPFRAEMRYWLVS